MTRVQVGRAAVSPQSRDPFLFFTWADALLRLGWVNDYFCYNSLASDLYLDKISVVTDCLSTVNHLKGSYLGSNAAIIHEIKEKMSEFVDAKISHVKRDMNWEAHDLAKSVVSLDVGRHLWLLNPPDFLCMPLQTLIE